VAQQFKLVVNQCPFCGERGVLRQDKFDHTVCTACGAGGEPPSESKRERNRIILACARNDDVSNPTMRVKSKTSGSRSKNHSDNRQKLQRATPYQIYCRLVDK
jgi:hypothetical protein